jgi:putative transposase
MNKPCENARNTIYLTTLTVGGRKHLLTNESCIQIILNSLSWMIETRQLVLFGFVLLPSHVLLLCRPLRREMQSLTESFAEFTANRMTAALRRRGRGPLLHYLHAKTPKATPGAPIWSGIKIQQATMPEDVFRWLDLMHRKPVFPEWNLAPEPEAYLYSSAGFYATGRQAVLPLADVRLEFADRTAGS